MAVHPGLHRQAMPRALALIGGSLGAARLQPALSSIAQIWVRVGCIIRARLLHEIQKCYDTNPQAEPTCMAGIPWSPPRQQRTARLAPVVGRLPPWPAFHRALPEAAPSTTSDSYRHAAPAQETCLQGDAGDAFGALTYSAAWTSPGDFHTEWCC